MSLLGRLLLFSKSSKSLLSGKTTGRIINKPLVLQRHPFVVGVRGSCGSLPLRFFRGVFDNVNSRKLLGDNLVICGTKWISSSAKKIKTRSQVTLAEYLLGPRPRPESPHMIGETIVAAFSGLGIMTLGIYGMHLSVTTPGIVSYSDWQAHVTERLRLTYAYFGCSTIWTALAAYGVFNSKRFMRALTSSRVSSPAMLVCTVAVQVVSGTAVMFVPYHGFGMKQICWILNASLMGITLAPMCYYGGAILIQAYLMTCGIIAGLSTIAFCAPDKSFLRWSAPIAMALGCCMAAALSSFWFPAGLRMGLDLMSLYFYGGLIAFSSMLFYDTEKIIFLAERMEHNDPIGWDPINSAMSLYMDALNIFVRFIQLFVLRQVKEFSRDK